MLPSPKAAIKGSSFTQDSNPKLGAIGTTTTRGRDPEKCKITQIKQ